jgi:hypothetical protein
MMAPAVQLPEIIRIVQLPEIVRIAELAEIVRIVELPEIVESFRQEGIWPPCWRTA